jgi:hypothetical protein
LRDAAHIDACRKALPEASKVMQRNANSMKGLESLRIACDPYHGNISH